MRVYDGEGTMLSEQRFTTAAGVDEMMRMVDRTSAMREVPDEPGACLAVYDGDTGERYR